MEELNEIKEKLNQCFGCKAKPCKSGCPLDNDITEIIRLVREGKYKDAYKVATTTSVLQSVCGRVCPHQSQCQGSCIRGIKSTPVCIGDIEMFLGDKAIEENYEMAELKKIEPGKRAAVVGSGPAGLTCAAFLARSGVEVTIYEKYNTLGGILRYGIPEFRLPKDVLDKNINKIINLGIRAEYGQELGKNLSLENLKKDYDAVFIAIGANISWTMGIDGENLEGVYGGNELLEKNCHPDYAGKTVIVSGGGNVAMDCARTIKRLGAKSVKVVYRRAEEQMPAEQKEIDDAKLEGVEFLFQNNIVRIYGDSKVTGIECIKTKLVKKEGDTRLSPVNIDGSNYRIDADYVIMAIGSTVERDVVDKLNLELDKHGYIIVDDKYKTSQDNVYAGGDLSGTKATVSWAAKTGRIAAESIIENMRKRG
ncbi:MAG: NAD(P)-dependent oxidoreductase [Clostridia bacterium]|nr:NAD(P)-dependent oxidoreductase [Clostridia bacterium]